MVAAESVGPIDRVIDVGSMGCRRSRARAPEAAYRSAPPVTWEAGEQRAILESRAGRARADANEDASRGGRRAVRCTSSCIIARPPGGQARRPPEGAWARLRRLATRLPARAPRGSAGWRPGRRPELRAGLKVLRDRRHARRNFRCPARAGALGRGPSWRNSLPRADLAASATRWHPICTYCRREPRTS